MGYILLSIKLTVDSWELCWYPGANDTLQADAITILSWVGKWGQMPLIMTVGNSYHISLFCFYDWKSHPFSIKLAVFHCLEILNQPNKFFSSLFPISFSSIRVPFLSCYHFPVFFGWFSGEEILHIDFQLIIDSDFSRDLLNSSSKRFLEMAELIRISVRNNCFDKILIGVWQSSASKFLHALFLIKHLFLLDKTPLQQIFYFEDIWRHNYTF